jgi:hypothetical protein
MKIINSFIQVIVVGVFLVLFSTPLTHAASTSSGAGGEACQALSQLDPGKGTNCNTSGPSINKLVRTVINILTFVAGAVAVIMIIISGLKYITSTGDATAAGNARKTLIYAVVGLIVVLFAQLIVKFVLDRAT